jgi:hypothetical protein
LIHELQLVVCATDLECTLLADHEHFTRLQHRRRAMNLEMRLLLDEIDKRFAA